jgi:hypothetical protein
MTIRDSNGNVLTKTALTALTSAVTPPAMVTVNALVYQDYSTPDQAGHFEDARKILFHAGAVVPQSVIDGLYPTATYTSISPATGAAAGGTPFTLHGTNLTGVTGVTFAGSAATSVVVVNDTTVTGVTPAHATGAVAVVIKDDNADVAAGSVFTYV